MTIIEHLEGMLGKSSSVLCHTESIDVRLWPDVRSPGMGVISTVGMSDHAQTVPKRRSCPSREPRTELLSFCHLEDASIFGQLLLDLSSYAFRDGNFLFWWHTLPLGQPLARGSLLDGVLLTLPPFAEEMVTFLVDQKRRDLVWVIPISASEFHYCRTTGVESFEEILERTNVDIADIFRTAVA